MRIFRVQLRQVSILYELVIPGLLELLYLCTIDSFAEENRDVVTLCSRGSSSSRGKGKFPVKVLKALKEGMAVSCWLSIC